MQGLKSVVKKYARLITVIEQTEGFYDYDDGGRYKTKETDKELSAAIFNLTSREISTLLAYGEGGSYTTGDIKIYVYEPLAIGSKVVYKDKAYTVSKEVDYSEHSEGLRVYFAKGASVNERA